MKDKFYVGLVIFALADEDVPNVGEKINLTPISNSKDPNAYGYTVNGHQLYLLANPDYINQVNTNTNNKYDLKANSFIINEYPQGCKAIVMPEVTSFDTAIS